jgi:hypothetical protein
MCVRYNGKYYIRYHFDMTTPFNQAQGRAANALDKSTNYAVRWRGVNYRVADLQQQRIYVPLTLVNPAGDVVKIFPDGSVYCITEEQWRDLATLVDVSE